MSAHQPGIVLAFWSIVLVSSCNPKADSVTREGARLVNDTPNVRRLVAEQAAQDVEQLRFDRESHTRDEIIAHVDDMKRHPERFNRGRREFLDAMASQPGVLVPELSSLRTTEHSDARCHVWPLYDEVWVKVRVLSGPQKGREGWMCQLCITGVSRGWP